MSGRTGLASAGLFRCGRAVPVLFLIALAASNACSPKRTPPQTSLLAQAEAHIQQLDWEASTPLLKQHLLAHPYDSRAHFQLGRCYLNGPTRFPQVAEGEFYTALKLFVEQGRKSPIEQFSDLYYELRCHLEVVKTYMFRLQWAEGHGAPPEVRAALLHALRAKLAAARNVDPTSGDVIEMEKFIDEVYGKVTAPDAGGPSARPEPEGMLSI